MVCTPGHQIYTADGKTQAGRLSSSSRPIVMGDRFSEDQWSVLLGTALGDGCINEHGGLKVFHTDPQREYVSYKALELGACAKDVDGGRVFNKMTREIVDLVPVLYEEVGGVRVKRIRREWLDRMGARGLAIFFCDGGSCSVTRNRLSVEFSTQCFIAEDTAEFQAWLKDTFDIDSRLLKARKDSRFGGTNEVIPNKFRLRIDLAASVRKFLETVSPYVPECMGYKIPFRDQIEEGHCGSCECLISLGRMFCSRCLWEDASRSLPWEYANRDNALVVTNAIYQRFGCWPAGKFTGDANPDDSLGGFLEELDRHSDTVCRSGFVGGVAGKVRRPPKHVDYSGPVHNLTVEGEHNYVLSCGLVVGNSIPYMDYSGPITARYGRGTVERGRRTQAEVYHADSDDAPGTKLRFNLYEGQFPEELALRKDQKGRWFLHNKTQTRESRPDLPASKASYKEIDPDDIDVTDSTQALMPKLDGSHTAIDLRAGRAPRAYSYRVGKKAKTGLIEHTHKIPGMLTKKVPKELDGTILRGEILGIKGDRALPAEMIGGLLNSKVWRSREVQEAAGVKLKVFPFDVEKYRGKSMEGASFDEKLEVLREVQRSLAELDPPEIAVTPEEKISLLNRVRSKKHPLTEEGFVLVDRNRASRPIKAKFAPDFDVFVRDIHPAISGKTGKPHDRAGAISYSWTADGPVRGQLGGFRHAEAKDMLKNPDKYVGRVAKVKAMKVFTDKEGNPKALFQPRFKEWHLDKGDIEKSSAEVKEMKTASASPYPAFLEELEKIALEKAAYGEREHAMLSRQALMAMGGHAPSDLGQMYTRAASRAADTGVRHPHLPFNPDVHAMPGGDKRALAKRIVDSRHMAERQLADAIRSGNQTAQVKAWRDLATTQHQWADLSAHFEKPLEAGRASQVARSRLGNVPGGRTLASGVEHVTGGLKPQASVTAPIGSHMDEWRPGQYRTDRIARKRATNWGLSSQKRIQQNLTAGGMTPQQAQQAWGKAMNQQVGYAPRVKGRVASDVGHLKNVGTQAKQRVTSGAKRVASGLGSRVGRIGARLGRAAILRR